MGAGRAEQVAEASCVDAFDVEGQNKWITIIQNAIHGTKEEEGHV
jgi:hypothetical protein